MFSMTVNMEIKVMEIKSKVKYFILRKILNGLTDFAKNGTM